MYVWISEEAMSCGHNPGRVFIPRGVSAEELGSRARGRGQPRSPPQQALQGWGGRRGLCAPRTHHGHPRAHPELEEPFCQNHHQWDTPPSPKLPADEVYGDRYRPNGFNLLRRAWKLGKCSLNRSERAAFLPPPRG